MAKLTVQGKLTLGLDGPEFGFAIDRSSGPNTLQATATKVALGTLAAALGFEHGGILPDVETDAGITYIGRGEHGASLVLQADLPGDDLSLAGALRIVRATVPAGESESESTIGWLRLTS